MDFFESFCFFVFVFFKFFFFYFFTNCIFAIFLQLNGNLEGTFFFFFFLTKFRRDISAIKSFERNYKLHGSYKGVICAYTPFFFFFVKLT
jgi:hypothetical protein